MIVPRNNREQGGVGVLFDVFDQHNSDHQTWLIGWASGRQLDGFYELQDLADLMQGRHPATVGSVAHRYTGERSKRSPQDFLAWLAGQRSAAGLTVAPWWQEAEDRARLMELPGK